MAGQGGGPSASDSCLLWWPIAPGCRAAGRSALSRACSGNPAPPQPQVINDKGTPFGDLLVPKLTASVKDGAVGVSVDRP